uniref:Putative e3 ubiquitin-protein ligase icp0 n=1 Tax=Anopheles darlingi TaxID=43151 RepID=A0A2M4CRI8_ANODA
MFSRLCKNTIFPTGVNQSQQQPATTSHRSSTSSAGIGTPSTVGGGAAGTTTGTSQSTNGSSTSSVRQPPPSSSSLPVSVGEGGGGGGEVGGSVAVVAAAIAADRRRRRQQQQQQQQQLAGRNLPSLPVAATRSRGPIRAPEPPPPYWAHYAHRPVPATVPPAVAGAASPNVARIGGASSSASAAGAAAAAPAAAAAAAVGSSGGGAGHNSATTTDDSDTSNDRPRAHRDRSTTSRERSSAFGGSGIDGAPGAPIVAHRGGRSEIVTSRHLRYNVQQRQRIKEHLLTHDAFCPDLVRNCKNIATDSPDRQSSASSSSSSPVSPAEYAEIADLGRRFATHATINVGASTSSARAVVGPVSAASGSTSQPTGASAGGPETGAAPTMGSNLSIRRPKISLTWVLREQQQQQQQQLGGRDGASSSNGQAQHHNQPTGATVTVGAASPMAVTTAKPSQGSGYTSSPAGVPPTAVSSIEGSLEVPSGGVPPHTFVNGTGQQSNGHRHTHHHHVIVRKKSRTRSKERLFSEKYVSDNNLSEYHSEKRERVVGTTYANDYTATPSAATGGNGTTNLYRKSNRKNSDRLKKKERLLLYANGGAVDPVGAAFHNNNNQHAVNLNKDPEGKEKVAVALKNTHSEPSLYTTVSEPSASTKHRHHRHHHHRRRRERYRSQRFGYEISNVDEFLSKCSLSSPGNIPVVLSSAATLYQTRPGSYQIEIPLPLGMVVNAVFKNQNWLYVQTPHAEEGYVAYDTCLPLGILPSNQRSTSSSKPTPCWETNKDVFPKLCGNLTDSEKEIQQLRGGTRSEGRRTPRLKRSSTNSRSAASITACNSERDLDSLYLRTVASNLPKVADGQAQYAQLKLTTKVLHSVAPTVKSEKALAIEQLEKLICSGSGDYVHLLKQQQKHLLHKQQQVLQQIRQQQQQQQQHHFSSKPLELTGAAVERGSVCSGNHQGTKVYGSGTNHLRIALGGGSTGAPMSVGGPVTPALAAAVATAAVRQTLLAITDNYCSEALNVHKGDVVTLLACKEYQEKGLKNYKQWFFVRTRDGHEGYIPAEAAGHGFL